MRHGKKFNHLGRKSGHRKAMLRNLTIALITHKRINTTLAKAKALRKFAEPLITKSRTNDTHNRRMVFSYLQNKEAVTELFSTVAEKVGDRPGGYLRVIKTGFRLGDGAETAMIEFVDFNDVYDKNADKSKGRTRRGRRRRGSKGRGGADSASAPAEGQTIAESTDAAAVATVAATTASATPAPVAPEEGQVRKKTDDNTLLPAEEE
jgi:large subunit ribosomal protein L17